MDHLLDLARFPLDQPGSPAWEALVTRCRSDMAQRGMVDLDGLVRPDVVRAALAGVLPLFETEAFFHARRHNIYFADIPDLPQDHPARAEFETVNHTLCADQIEGNPILEIYEYPGLATFLAALMEKPELHTMRDPLARVNVMRYGAGEALNWHFDRSEFTTTLLLQAPDFGGIFQYARDLRSEDDPGYDNVARLLSEDWPITDVRLAPGTLNIFKGRNTAHRVTPAAGPHERVVAVFSYYDRPGVMFSDAERIGFYGRAA